jgi:hypothetical protein
MMLTMNEQLFPTQPPSFVRALDRRTRQAGLKGVAQARSALADARHRAESRQNPDAIGGDFPAAAAVMRASRQRRASAA